MPPGPGRDIRIDAITTNDSRALRALATDLDRAGDSTTHLDKNMAHLGTTSRELDRHIIEHRRQIALLGQEYVRTGDASLLGEANERRAMLRRLERTKMDIRKALTDENGNGGGFNLLADIGKGFKNPTGIRFILGAATVLSAPLGAMIGGAIVGASGVGGIAGGIAAAAHDPRVRTAFGKFTDNIKQQFFDVGTPFVQPTIKALDTLKQGVAGMHLSDMLKPLSTDVDDLARGVAGFGTEFSHGFTDAIQHAGPFVDALEEGLPRIGDALGDVTSELARNKGALQGWKDLLSLTSGTIRFVGGTLNFLSNTWMAFRDSAESHLVARALNESAEATGVWTGKIKGATSAVREYSDEMQTAIDKTFALEDAHLGAQNAEIAYNRALLDVNDSIKENGKSTSLLTEEGLNNRDAILNVVSAAQRQRDAMLAAGSSAEEANNHYANQIEALKGLLTKLGLTKQQIDDLIDAYGRIPKEITTVVRYTEEGRPVNAQGQVFQGPILSKNKTPSGGAKYRAAGGTVWAGELYSINEVAGRPSEMFRPAMNGEIISLGGRSSGHSEASSYTVVAQFGTQTITAHAVRVQKDVAWDNRVGVKK